MNEIKLEFEVREPEADIAWVASPQVLVHRAVDGKIKVIVYFMINNAMTITGGTAQSAMGKVKLWFRGESPSGLFTASNRVAKIEYTFPNPQGMARNFEFMGQR